MVKLNSRTRYHQMRERESGELRAEVEKLKKEFFDLRFKGAMEAISSPARFQQIRRDIARIETILRDRELKGAAK